jgi:hypothetical protein
LPTMGLRKMRFPRMPCALITEGLNATSNLLPPLIAGASRAFAADGCPTGASEISTDRPDVTYSSRVVPYGSLQAENGVDWTVCQGSNVISGSETKLRLGVAQCIDVLADCRRIFTRSTAAAHPLDYPTLSSPSSGNCRLRSASTYPQPAVWGFRPVPARFRATDTIRSLHSIPMVAPARRRLVTPRYVHCHMVHEPTRKQSYLRTAPSSID